MFASLDQLRRMPANGTANADDWKWVLRSTSTMRPVLEWVDGGTLSVATIDADSGKPHPPRVRMEFTDGARRPVSASTIASSPATAVAYDQKLGGTSRVILAGQMSYDNDTPAGGIATVWLRQGRSVPVHIPRSSCGKPNSDPSARFSGVSVSTRAAH